MENPDYPSRQILGVRFFLGSANDVVARASRDGGVVVVPAAPAMVKLKGDEAYRRALTGADFAIPDSGLMVLLWKVLRREELTRISGLAYLKRLLLEPEFRERGRSFFVLPTETAKARLILFAMVERLEIDAEDCYVAPLYGESVEDPQLLIDVENHRPAHIIIAIGNGPQEKLGYFLRELLSYRPAIHCIGAALGFLTGDQITIPNWADRLYLGWLFRLVAQPRIFIPRLTRALALPAMIARYRSELPPIKIGN